MKKIYGISCSLDSLSGKDIALNLKAGLYTKLIMIYIYCHNLGTLENESLVKSLKIGKFTNLKSFSCYTLSSCGYKNIDEYSSINSRSYPDLTKSYLNANFEDCKNEAFLSNHKEIYPHLAIIYFHGKNLKSEGGQVFLETLSSLDFCNLSLMEICINNFHREDNQLILNLFHSYFFSNLTHLCFSGIRIDNNKIKFLASYLKLGVCSNLKYFDLSENNIDSVGAKELASVLKLGVCPNLINIDLSENNIDSITKSKVYKSFNISPLQKNLFQLKCHIKLLKHNLKDVHAYNFIGNMFYNLKRGDKAVKYFKAVDNSKMVIKIFESLLEQNPKDADLSLRIGNYYLDLRNLNKAKYYYNNAKSIEKNPNKQKIIENKISKTPEIYEKKLDDYAQTSYKQKQETFLTYEQLEHDIQDIDIELAGLSL